MGALDSFIYFVANWVCFCSPQFVHYRERFDNSVPEDNLAAIGADALMEGLELSGSGHIMGIVDTAVDPLRHVLRVKTVARN